MTISTGLKVLIILALPAAAHADVDLLDARSTQRFVDVRGARYQTVAVTARNTGPEWITPRNPVRIVVAGAGIRTTAPAIIRNLGPEEVIRIETGIAATIYPGEKVPALVVAGARGMRSAVMRIEITAATAEYRPDIETLSRHESPAWFDGAKLGIFINWGLYSVPAWAPSGLEYAEWYWHALNRRDSPTRQYHLRTYGMEFSYDDFIARFTGAAYDPNDWIELIRESRARYFVIDAKHHDGFALYDTATTGRNSVALGPRRDVVREVFEAARARAPEIKRGVYYSLYEWFHPAYAGTLPLNSFTGSMLRYTGAWPVADFVGDHMLPQMRELIDRYDPDILWCDGSWERDAAYWRTRETVARYFNQAMRRERPKDVVVNNRCGVADPYESPLGADFLTPEYTSFRDVVPLKWESNRGLDPFSYGYNRATAEADYMTTDQVVDTLADIVSKNGNLLLNIGPDASGAIPPIMRRRLRELGAWLDVNGEAIFDTTYWMRTSQENSLRFTVKPNEAFYIISLDPPGERLTLASPVPIADSHAITLLGYDRPLRWWREDGRLVMSVPPEARASSEHAWVFKVSWLSR